MARTPQRIVLDLRTQRVALRDSNPAVRATALAAIDALLDERLEQQEAHPPECRCEPCVRVVADALARRYGELVDVRDVASEAEWGAAGLGD